MSGAFGRRFRLFSTAGTIASAGPHLPAAVGTSFPIRGGNSFGVLQIWAGFFGRVEVPFRVIFIKPTR